MAQLKKELCLQVELQTVRQKVVLYDNSTAPLPFLAPGSRHDFIIQHDIKELGIHSLICSTVYTGADGERRYTPETFKFTSANPLYVKTKVGCVAQGESALSCPCCGFMFAHTRC